MLSPCGKRGSHMSSTSAAISACLVSSACSLITFRPCPVENRHRRQLVLGHRQEMFELPDPGAPEISSCSPTPESSFAAPVPIGSLSLSPLRRISTSPLRS
jgi:hypothetical protein